MSKERTYEDYKLFFEEVNKANRLEFYQYSFTLLFSFLEDRINKIYSEQYPVIHNTPPTEHDMKQSLYSKMYEIQNTKGIKMTFNPSFFKTLQKINKRRNEIIHEALFNLNTISKSDIDYLTKFCREIDKIRRLQKREHGKDETIRKPLVLRFSKPLPDLSTFRKIDNPTSYPLSHR